MMIWVDYAIVSLIGISLIIGFLRGFLREAFALVIWIAATWIGLTFSRELSALLTSVVAQPSLRIALAFGLLFVVTLIIGAIISFLLGELIKKTGLSGLDRLLGMVFGVVRGAVVVALIILLAGLTPLPEDPWWRESTLIPPFQSLATWLKQHIPSGLAGTIDYRSV
ncbi:MAG: CvpA family protein [Methylococcales bacterium]|nr:CvpA family protein [Methylococcales bacterium]